MDSCVLGPHKANHQLQIIPFITRGWESIWKPQEDNIEEAVITAIAESAPFEVETDAADVALAATLNRNGRPVAFFSRTLEGEWAETCVSCEVSRSDSRGIEAMEIFPDRKTFHPYDRPEVCILYVWPVSQRKD